MGGAGPVRRRPFERDGEVRAADGADAAEDAAADLGHHRDGVLVQHQDLLGTVGDADPAALAVVAVDQEGHAPLGIAHRAGDHETSCELTGSPATTASASRRKASMPSAATLAAPTAATTVPPPFGTSPPPK